MLTLALEGGDDALQRELADAIAGDAGLALLPSSSADRAGVLVVADDASASALDRARAARAVAPARAVVVITDADGVSPAAAMACGARALLGRPLSTHELRSALEAGGCFEARAAARGGGRGAVVVLGARGGVGATTCALALALARQDVLVDLDLAGGDAAELVGARVTSPDALLALTTAPSLAPAEVEPALAQAAGDLRLLPGVALPEQADLIDEVGVARLLDAAAAAGLGLVVDGGQRVGVETVPALERASAIVIVTSADVRGARGATRLGGLLGRLALAERPVGLAVVGGARFGPSRGAEVAEVSGIDLWAAVASDRAVRSSAEAGGPPPLRPFAALVRRLDEVAPR